MKEEIYEEEKRKSDSVFIYTSCNHIVSVFCFDPCHSNGMSGFYEI